MDSLTKAAAALVRGMAGAQAPAADTGTEDSRGGPATGRWTKGPGCSASSGAA